MIRWIKHKMTITQEQARKDLEKILSQFKTIGLGNEADRAAQMVLQTIDVLGNRLENKRIIEMLYLENPEAQKLLPDTVYEVARDYTQGNINAETARKMLNEAKEQYLRIFAEKGIKP